MAVSTCVICGAEFPARPRKLTCSAACAKLRAKRQRPSRTPGRRDELGRLLVACAECGREYPAERGRKTCSDECAQTRYRRAQRAAKRREWERDPEAAREKQRRRRAANVEHYRARDRERKKRPPPIAVCRRCGKKFAANRKDARFCSAACAERPKVIDLHCRYCNQLFRGRRGQKYCSPHCSQRAMAERSRRRQRRAGLDTEISLAALAIGADRPAGRFFHECVECGEEFRSDSAQALYCAPACRRASLARRKRRGPQRLPPVDCEICGRSFQPDRRNARLCSADCRAEKKRRVMRERQKEPTVRVRSKRLYRRRKGVDLHCVICGRDMSSLPDLRTNRYTCSPACRDEARRQKNRRSYERRKERAESHQDGRDRQDD